MNVLIDTCVWSLVFRRKSPDIVLGSQFRQLVLEGRGKIIGPIRQELLSGITNTSQFELLKSRLQAFDDIDLRTEHYVTAAEICNSCRAKGVAGSHADFLICSVSKIEKLEILTTDRDFEHYSRVVGLTLCKIG
jgi:predicted nucleic acid-binding protein